MVAHHAVLIALSDHLPPVTLLLGPERTGKRALALEVIRRHGLNGARLLEFDKLNAEAAREVVRFSSVRGADRTVLVNLDGASGEALNALLKTLEEPPSHFRVVMTASRRPPLTIQSRARTFVTGYLLDSEVEETLKSRGMAEGEAKRQAALARGQIPEALDVRAGATGTVLSVLRSVGARDLAAFMAVVGGRTPTDDGRARDTFGEEELECLREWCTEYRTGRWRLFSPSSTFGIDARTAEKIRRSLSSDARPKLAVKQALLSSFR